MNFLGLGPAEIFVVMLLALIVFGPGKLPEIGQQVGRAIRQFRSATSEITEEFNRELNIEKMLQDPPKQPAPAPSPEAPLSQAAATIATAAAAEGVLDQPEESEIPAPSRPVITVAGDEEAAPVGLSSEPDAPSLAESTEPVAPDPLPAEYPYGELLPRTDAAPEDPAKPVEDAPETVAEEKKAEETGV